MTSGVLESSVCVCGHPRRAHEHLRRGTDCALCSRDCPRYRPAGRALHRVARVGSLLHRRHG